MKVLLLVQTGDARPKCAGRAAASAEGVRGHLFYEVRLDGTFGARAYLGAKAGRAKNAADRWWLVECENADAGRFIIARALHPDAMPQPFDTHVDGRILASGGRHDRA